MNSIEKLCPTCNKENKDTDLICIHCGARLDAISTKFVGIPASSENVAVEEIESFIDLEWIPENGIGIQVAGEATPIYVPVRTELVIGRTTEYTSPADDFLDLAHLNAAALGVSRKHVTIRRTDSGDYEVIDLTSRNGSWLNDNRLVPNRPSPLPNESTLRIGNMYLLIMYRPAR